MEDTVGAYHRNVLSPLRAAAQVPEHFVGQHKFDEVNYNRMASRCRLIHGEKVFKKHDEARYKDFLSQAARDALSGKKDAGAVSVKSGVLLPHEVTAEANRAV